MHNRRVKFGWKIPSCFGNIATSPQGGIFLTHTVCLFTCVYKVCSVCKCVYTGCTKKTTGALFSTSWHAAMWSSFSGGDSIDCGSVHVCLWWGWHVHPSRRRCKFSDIDLLTWHARLSSQRQTKQNIHHWQKGFSRKHLYWLWYLFTSTQTQHTSLAERLQS